MNLKEFAIPAFLQYAIKLLMAFCFLYFGALAIIGFSTPGGYYNSFVREFLDFPSALRASLLYASQSVLSVFRYHSEISGSYFLKGENGQNIQLTHSSLGLGIMCFWAAFVLASYGSLSMKITWIMSGSFALWVINVARISLVLLTGNKPFEIPFGLSHNTVYSIFAYSLVFLIMLVFDRIQRKKFMVETGWQ